MITFDEHGRSVRDDGHEEINPFHPDHISNPVYDAIRTLWARSHPEELAYVDDGLDKGV